MPTENVTWVTRELLDRLRGAPPGSITVVTPNRRLAGFVRSEYDRMHSEARATAWESADILPFDALLERLW